MTLLATAPDSAQALAVPYVPPRLTKKKIAIVGFSDSTRMDAPFDDPEWEIWTLNMHAGLPRVDRRFEQHDRKTIDDEDRDLSGAFLKMLRDEAIPVYMLDVQPDIPTSVRFPIDDFVATFGAFSPKISAGYCESSFGYMIGLAIMLFRANRVNPWLPEGEEIGIFGVDLTLNEEYAYQRPNAEMFCGLAMGSGITLHVPAASAIFSSAGGGLYGYQAGEKWQVLNELKGYLTTRARELQDEFVKVQAAQNLDVTKMQILDGLKQQTKWTHDIVMHLLRGGSITDKKPQTGGQK